MVLWLGREGVSPLRCGPVEMTAPLAGEMGVGEKRVPPLRVTSVGITEVAFGTDADGLAVEDGRLAGPAWPWVCFQRS